MGDYLKKLCDDIKETFKLINELGLNVVTVYIGGGTPTTLSAEQLSVLLDTINNCTDTSKLEEFTLEAGRPDTVTAEKLEVIKRGGVTRISVNTQTLNNEVLEIIGRNNTVEDFYREFELARN